MWPVCNGIYKSVLYLCTSVWLKALIGYLLLLLLYFFIPIVKMLVSVRVHVDSVFINQYNTCVCPLTAGIDRLLTFLSKMSTVLPKIVKFEILEYQYFIMCFYIVLLLISLLCSFYISLSYCCERPLTCDHCVLAYNQILY